MKSANLALRFLLEICALVALGYWGFNIKRDLPIRLILGIGAPLLAMLVWGTLGAPAASARLPEPQRLLLELVILGTAAVALYASGARTVAGLFALAVAVNRALMFAWGQ